MGAGGGGGGAERIGGEATDAIAGAVAAAAEGKGAVVNNIGAIGKFILLPLA